MDIKTIAQELAMFQLNYHKEKAETDKILKDHETQIEELQAAKNSDNLRELKSLISQNKTNIERLNLILSHQAKVQPKVATRSFWQKLICHLKK